MTGSQAGASVLLIAAALTLTGCGRGPGTPVETSPAPAAAADSLAELEAIYRARADSARGRFTAADIEFVNGMIAHHAQALVMAGLAETHSASAAVRTLAARITNAQEDEIASMQQWLRERGQPAPEVHVDPATLTMHGPQSHAHVPGMLTESQLRALDRATGTEFDRLFLTYMIAHHRGAIAMVHDLLASDGAAQDPQTFKLASDIQADQTAEIERMESMLSALPSGGTAP